MRVAWTECQDWLDQVIIYLQANGDFLADFAGTQMTDVRHLSCEATYLAWLDCSQLDLKLSPMRYFLKRAKVGLSSGDAFGEAGKTFVCMNFATSRRILTEMLERMAESRRH